MNNAPPPRDFLTCRGLLRYHISTLRPRDGGMWYNIIYIAVESCKFGVIETRGTARGGRRNAAPTENAAAAIPVSCSLFPERIAPQLRIALTGQIRIYG